MQAKFVLLKDLDDTQLEQVLSQNNLYSLVSKDDLDLLPDINFNNFINICNFVDYYQLVDDTYFLDVIRYNLLLKNIKLDDISNSQKSKIYDCECLLEMKCNITQLTKHVCCHWFWEEYNRRENKIYKYFKQYDGL